jgi:hypothetical protein
VPAIEELADRDSRVHRRECFGLKSLLLLHEAFELEARRFFVLALTVLRLRRPVSSGSRMEPNHRPSDCRWYREPSPFILRPAIVVRSDPEEFVPVAYIIAYILARDVKHPRPELL